MKNFPQSQKGLSLLGWLMALVVVAFLASATLKMLPHYFDYMSLDKIIESMQSQQNLDTARDIYNHIEKNMQVSNIRGIDIEDALKVEIEEGEFKAHLKYEKRESLIRNLDLVARFDKEYRIRMP